MNAAQKKAYDGIVTWATKKSKKKAIVTLLGSAGTGKTYLVSMIRKTLIEKGLKVFTVTVTGKASSVLRKKGVENAQTICSLIYSVKENEETGKLEMLLDHESEIKDADLIIIDEISMVSKEDGENLFSFNVPILAVGDVKNQLPPVEGDFFLYPETPDYELTEPVRTGEQSVLVDVATSVAQNPLTDLYSFRSPDYKVLPRTKLDQRIILAADQILCGTHKTRKQINNLYNQATGQGFLPDVGAKIVITRNLQEKGHYNGEIAFIKKYRPIELDELETMFYQDDEIYSKKDFNTYLSLFKSGAYQGEEHRFAEISFVKEGTEEEYTDIMYLGEFEIDHYGKEFMERQQLVEEAKMCRALEAIRAQYGACLTVHRSQGSEWDKVIVIDDGFGNWEGKDSDIRRRWLYTAITRSSDKLVIFK